jgi:hypothetical protein
MKQNKCDEVVMIEVSLDQDKCDPGAVGIWRERERKNLTIY